MNDLNSAWPFNFEYLTDNTPHKYRFGPAVFYFRVFYFGPAVFFIMLFLPCGVVRGW
jgi:hypothetical protein